GKSCGRMNTSSGRLEVTLVGWRGESRILTFRIPSDEFTRLLRVGQRTSPPTRPAEDINPSRTAREARAERSEWVRNARDPMAPKQREIRATSPLFSYPPPLILTDGAAVKRASRRRTSK